MALDPRTGVLVRDRRRDTDIEKPREDGSRDGRDEATSPEARRDRKDPPLDPLGENLSLPRQDLSSPAPPGSQDCWSPELGKNGFLFFQVLVCDHSEANAHSDTGCAFRRSGKSLFTLNTMPTIDTAILWQVSLCAFAPVQDSGCSEGHGRECKECLLFPEGSPQLWVNTAPLWAVGVNDTWVEALWLVGMPGLHLCTVVRGQVSLHDPGCGMGDREAYNPHDEPRALHHPRQMGQLTDLPGCSEVSKVEQFGRKASCHCQSWTSKSGGHLCGGEG